MLLKVTDNIPNERVQVLQETVASYHGVPSSEITREMIEEASEVDSRYYIQGFSQSRKQGSHVQHPPVQIRIHSIRLKERFSL